MLLPIGQQGRRLEREADAGQRQKESRSLLARAQEAVVWLVNRVSGRQITLNRQFRAKKWGLMAGGFRGRKGSLERERTSRMPGWTPAEADTNLEPSLSL